MAPRNKYDQGPVGPATLQVDGRVTHCSSSSSLDGPGLTATKLSIPRFSRHTMAMECLAQELIDGIIDRVPLEHLQFCSLVARRWLRRSQQGLFERVAYKSEDLAYRWHTRIPQDPEGIPSYVRSVQVQDLTHCREPGMLHSILRCFANLTSLDLGRIDLSLLSEPGNPTLFGHFWRKLANLSINNTTCTYGTLVPLILSFPSLERLLLSRLELGGTPLSTLPDTPKRVSQALWVHGGCQNVLMTLARFPFSFRTITVARAPSDVPPSGDLRALLAASSGIVEKVTMCGESSSSPIHWNYASNWCCRHEVSPGQRSPSRRFIP